MCLGSSNNIDINTLQPKQKGTDINGLTRIFLRNILGIFSDCKAFWSFSVLLPVLKYSSIPLRKDTSS